MREHAPRIVEFCMRAGYALADARVCAMFRASCTKHMVSSDPVVEAVGVEMSILDFVQPELVQEQF